MKQELEKPAQVDPLEIFDENARIVKGYGSIEIYDKSNQLLPMSEFKKIMPVIMKRGGLIMDMHSNRPVGKILNYEFKQHPGTEEEGVYLTTQVYDDYEYDDKVWDRIKNGEYSGFSFGGRSQMKEISFEKGMKKEILRKLEGYEFSYVPSPANGPSLIDEINYLAKGNDQLCKECGKRLEDETKKALSKEEVIDVIEENLSQTKKDNSLELCSDKTDKYLKKTDLSNNMNAEKKDCDNVQKEGQAPQADSLESRLVKLEQMVAQLMQAQAAPAPMPAAPVQKEDKSSSVKLPKDVAEEADQMDNTGAKNDKVSIVEKMSEEIKKMKTEVIEELKKSLATSTTPRPNTSDMVNKADPTQNHSVKSWRDADKVARELVNKVKQ